MNNDLISRKALKKAICIDEPISIDETWEQLYDAVVKAIDNAPTVEAYTEEDAKQAIKDSFDSGYEMAKNKYERPQGEWIRVDDNIGTCFVCDHCGNKGHVSKFCSNCGAKMKGGAE